MKVQSREYRIVRAGTTWTVEAIASGRVVWRGKTFKGARTAHAQRELRIAYRVARRLGN